MSALHSNTAHTVLLPDPEFDPVPVSPVVTDALYRVAPEKVHTLVFHGCGMPIPEQKDCLAVLKLCAEHSCDFQKPTGAFRKWAKQKKVSHKSCKQFLDSCLSHVPQHAIPLMLTSKEDVILSVFAVLDLATGEVVLSRKQRPLGEMVTGCSISGTVTMPKPQIPTPGMTESAIIKSEMLNTAWIPALNDTRHFTVTVEFMIRVSKRLYANHALHAALNEFVLWVSKTHKNYDDHEFGIFIGDLVGPQQRIDMANVICRKNVWWNSAFTDMIQTSEVLYMYACILNHVRGNLIVAAATIEKVSLTTLQVAEEITSGDEFHEGMLVRFRVIDKPTE